MRNFCAIAFACLVANSQAIVVNLDGGGSIAAGIGNQFTFRLFGERRSIADLDFRLSIQHPNIGQLWFELWHPLGMSVAWERLGIRGTNMQDTLLDDEAGGARMGQPGAQDGPFACPEWGGQRYRPPTDLSIFDGVSPSGVWTLNIWDMEMDNPDGQLFGDGEAAPWGTTIGTQLLITVVPEPSGIAILAAPRGFSVARPTEMSSLRFGILEQPNRSVHVSSDNHYYDALGFIGSGGRVPTSGFQSIAPGPRLTRSDENEVQKQRRKNRAQSARPECGQGVVADSDDQESAAPNQAACAKGE